MSKCGKRKAKAQQKRRLLKYTQNAISLVADLLTETPKRRPPKQQRAPSVAFEIKIKSFYCSKEWATARYKALKASDGKCECCGRSPADNVKLVVDHIKPLRHFWALRLDPANHQVLCNMCNRGKGSWDDTDWREESHSEQLSAYYGIPFH